MEVGFFMIGHMEAVYLGKESGSFEDNGKKIAYCTLALQNPDVTKSSQIMKCFSSSDLEVDKLVQYQKYLFIIDIPIILKDKAKVKVLGIVPFKEDNKVK